MGPIQFKPIMVCLDLLGTLLNRDEERWPYTKYLLELHVCGR